MTHARNMPPAIIERMTAENTTLKLQLALAKVEMRRMQATVEAQDKRIAALEHVIGNEWLGDL